MDYWSCSANWQARNFHISIPDTPVGTDVVVNPIDHSSGTVPVTLTYSEIITPGTTSLTTSESGLDPPSAFKLGSPKKYYNIETTSNFAGNVEVCIDYSETYYENENQLVMHHFEGGSWVDVTSSHNMDGDINLGLVAYATFCVI